MNKICDKCKLEINLIDEEDIIQHKDKYCPNEIVECNGKIYGCQYKELRKRIKNHQDNCEMSMFYQIILKEENLKNSKKRKFKQIEKKNSIQVKTNNKKIKKKKKKKNFFLFNFNFKIGKHRYNTFFR